MATQQLQTLVSLLQREQEAGENISGLSDSVMEARKAMERTMGVRGQDVKQESPQKPSSQRVSPRRLLAGGLSTHSSHGNGDLMSSPETGSNEHNKKPRTELRVSLRRLSPSMIPPSHVENIVSHEKNGKSSNISRVNTTGSWTSNTPRLSSAKGPQLDRCNTYNRDTLSSQAGTRNIDVLSNRELKVLLMKSQSTIRLLRNKLKECRNSENEVFGKLIGKMISSIKSRRRLEGLKLHIHDLVCETMLDDLEEGRARP